MVTSVTDNIMGRDIYPPVVPNSKATFAKGLNKEWDFRHLAIRNSIEDNISMTSLTGKGSSKRQTTTIKVYSRMANRMATDLRGPTNINT
jgi:hypothetical protein